MTTAEFLLQLKRLEGKVWAEGDRLRCSAPKGILTPQLSAALFESPTVAGLSALIVQSQAAAFGEDELTQLLAEAQNQGSRGSE